MSRNALIWLVIAIVVILGGVWYFSGASAGSGTASGAMEGNEYQQGSGASSTPSGSRGSATVNYDGTSFSPSSLTVHAGDTVTFVDHSASSMWIASGVHPSHELYDGTSRAIHCATGYAGPAPFDECAASSANYSFTFTKAGAWPYHDHLNAGVTGKIIVQ